MRKVVSPPDVSTILLLGLFAAATADAQFTQDREPIGPSSRKTGLVISEIMYHPRPVPLASTNALQFVEVFNSYPWDENIGGYAIDGSVHFAIPSNTVLRAQSYLVIARQPALVQSQYAITNVLGPWDNATANGLPTSKGVVQLRNREGAVLLEVDYSDNAPWPIAADGKGHSLVLARPSYGENDARAWAESDSIGGSPGRFDPVSVEPIASVMINEWMAHTDPPLYDSVELYNHANVAVNLSGAYLSDQSDTNLFRIADGTVIPARGFLVYDERQLGFGLYAQGETIFLVNSNQTRVIDVIDFKGMSNGVSAGRWPDGGPLQYGLAARTFGTNNSAPFRYAVVINELMFNPISGNNDDEYIEIFNRSSNIVDIGAWTFINGVSYTFPSNTFMPSGAYFVLARNPTNLFALYPNLNASNTFGPYSGSLANSGERVTLAAADYDTIGTGKNAVTIKLNVIVSDLTYGDGGRWSSWGDGDGSSLELIDPEADTRLPSNWADSDEGGKSEWTAIEYKGPIGETLGSNVNDSVIIALQDRGECLIDEIEVHADNGPNLVANGGFESGLAGWTLQGSHDFSTLEAGGFAGGRCLHLRAGSRGDNQCNRILSAPFGQPISTNAALVSIRAKARWLHGPGELLIRLHGGGAEAFGQMAIPRRLGTPGMVNSRRIANAGPAISQTQHAPLLPAASQPVVVSARANDFQGVASCALKYRLDPSSVYITLPMLDDGTVGDTIANDGIYSATVPGQPAGTMVAFYIEARDSLGATNRFPQDVFHQPGLDRCWPNDAVARECVVRWGETQMPGNFATYHLWLTSANSNRWHTRDPLNNSPMDGTFVYNNSRVIYDALPLFSGSPWHRAQMTNGPAGVNRVDYVMNFPSDDPLLGTTDFVLNNPGNPDLATISDLSAMAEQTVYKIFEGMGLIHNQRRYVHVFVNGNQRSTTPQRSGNFIFEDSQQPDGDMIDEWFPDDPSGELYKIEDWFEFANNGYDFTANNDADLTRRTILQNGQPTLVPAPYRFMFRKRSLGAGESANDYSRIFELIDAASPAENPTNAVIDPVALGAVADWEQWMRFFAVQRTVGNFDSYGWERGKNDYLYRATNGLFQNMTWDIDYCMGLGRPPDEPLFVSNDPRVAAMFNTPEIVRAYWRGFQDLVNGPFNNANLDPFLDARAAALIANGVNIDASAVAAIKTYIADRGSFLQTQLATVGTVFSVDGASTFSMSSNLLVLTGSAPVGVKTILVNGVAGAVTWTTVTNFTLELLLNPGVNAVSLQGVDLSGNAIAGANRSLSVNYTGPPANPVGALVFTEIMAVTDASGGQFVEVLNRSAFSFDVSGWRVDGAGFIFPSNSIIASGEIIVLARDLTAFAAAYGTIPVFGQLGVSLLPEGQTLAIVKPGVPKDLLINAVRYEAQLPWPTGVPEASLQLIDVAQDNSRASNWAMDGETPATPGAPNSVAQTLPAYDPLWLNEVQPENLAGPADNFGEHDPWLEVYNSGGSTLNLSGYYLANNFDSNLTQWPFPPGTTIAPGEFKLIWADGQTAQTSGTNLHASFRLPSNGSLALVRLTNGQPQITDYLSWTSPGANLSYGDFVDGQPIYRFAMQDSTPRHTNTTHSIPVFINEWMAGNTATIRDPADNSFNSWFELFNAGVTTLDLGGFYLTDTRATPKKFLVPTNGQYILAPGGFLLVWADNTIGQNTPARADLHVNFLLPLSAGTIALYAPDGVTAVNVVTYGQQTNNVSQGRYADGASALSFMTKPTPRAPNSLPGFNTPPLFAPMSDQVVSPGQLLAFTAAASDSDLPAQTLSFSLVSAPPGASVGSAGAFSWTPPVSQPPGDYVVMLRVIDNGSPPRSATGTARITVHAAPFIYASEGTGGQATFSFVTIPGHTYRVLYKDDLAAATWTQLNVDFAAADTTASITDNFGPAPHRFYRVLQVD